MPRNLEKLQEWKEENKEKILLYQREWARNNRDKRRKYEIAWREKNPAKVKEMNKKGGAKWAQNNKALKNYSSALRRAKLKKATPQWANLHKIKEIYIKANELTLETGIPHEVDHIYPIQGEFVCGLHVENNLQIIPMSDNRRKKNHCVF